MSELKQLYVPPRITEEFGCFKVTREDVTMDEFERDIKAPDMVSVVRCRDCKHYTDDGMEYYNYCCEWYEQVEPDGFCAWGVREDGDAR